MIYTELTVKAMKIAYAAHHGQYDKGGVPYILHPVHVAEQMSDEMATCAALLHDVVEDTEITFANLAEEFPQRIIDALKLLTHDEDEDYYEYVRRLRDDPIALEVKLADLAHNMDESRLMCAEHVTEEKMSYLREKYRKAKELLRE